MKPSPLKNGKNKRKIVYLNSRALSRGLWRTLWHTCYVMGRNLAIGFLDKICFFFVFFCFYIFYICVFVFCGECGCICMNRICVADISCDYSDWMRAMNAYEWLYGPYLYDYHLYYPAHQCVITDIISVCLAIRECTWVCTTYKYIFFFLSFYYSNCSYCIFLWSNKSLIWCLR